MRVWWSSQEKLEAGGPKRPSRAARYKEVDVPPSLFSREGSGSLPSGKRGFSGGRDEVPSVNEVVTHAWFLL